MVSATVVSISQSYENIPVVADVFAQNYDSGAPGAADVLVRQPKYSTCLFIILVYLSLILVAIFHSSMFPLVPIRSSHMSGANTSSARAAGPQGFCGRRPQHCKELYMRRKRTLKVLLDACRGSRDNSIPGHRGIEDRKYFHAEP